MLRPSIYPADEGGEKISEFLMGSLFLAVRKPPLTEIGLDEESENDITIKS